MGFPLRDKNPAVFRLISIRTEEARLFMVPNKEMRKLTGGIVARYQEIFGIEIYALIYLSNHPHLLVRAPKSNIDEFCENVHREVARRVNWRNNRRGKFWGRRYTDLHVVSESDLLEAFLYVTTNAVRHGLVDDPKLWPGLSSYSQSITEKEETFIFHHYSAARGEPQVTEHTLRISPLPQFAALPPKKRKKVMKKLIDERTQELIKARREAGQGFLGLKGVQLQDPFSRPREISNKPRGPIYSKDPCIIREFSQKIRERRGQYIEASMRFRAGALETRFPENSFKPPLHRKPRIIPFRPLSPEHFKNSNPKTKG